jgi:DNA primase
MAAHLAGITTAVATCGTAFGDDHIRVIRRLLMDDDAFRGEVIFTFDGDAAGQKAALRAFGDDQKFVAQTFVAVEPSGMDPCDLRIASGDAAVRDLIARRVPLFEFAIKSEIAKYDVNSAEGRVSALNQVAPLIGKIRDASLRPEYARLVAGWLGMEVDIVTSAIKKTSTRSVPSQNLEPAIQSEVNLRDPILMMEREVLKIKLQHPDMAKDWALLEKNAFTYWAYHQLRTQIDSSQELNIQKLLESSESEDIRALITELTVEPIRTDREISERYIAAIFARLREVALSRSIAEIKSTLQRLNPTENEAQYNETFGALVAMEAERRVQKDAALGELG